MSDPVAIALITAASTVLQGFMYRDVRRVKKQTNGLVDRLVHEARTNAKNEAQKEFAEK